MAGRKSTASLTVLKTPKLDKRLDAPGTLTARQREIWVSVVNTKPADWFTDDTAALLVAYVKSVDQHELLSLQVESFDMSALCDMDGVKMLDRLHAMQERQARLFQSLATRMRLTQQSRWQPATASSKTNQSAGSARPWDVASQ
jgi:hypothetical protein